MSKVIFNTILLILVLGLGACKQKVKKAQLPYEEERVIGLLADIHYAKVASKIHKKEDQDSIRTVFENQVFEINKISRSEYKDLLRILESDLNLYYDIEKKVHVHLKSIQNKKS